MINFTKHLINERLSIKGAMEVMDPLGKDAILFVVDDKGSLLASVTDGDIRRGLITGFKVDEKALTIANLHPKYLLSPVKDTLKLIQLRENNYKIIPLLDKQRKVIDIINFNYTKSILPIDVIIMAGGEGQRLRPLTEEIPKPMLPIGQKPILEHNIDRLILFGVKNFYISIKYLGDQIKNYFGDGGLKEIDIKYLEERKKLGTIGAVSLITEFKNEYILLSNSDLITNIDFEDFFNFFITNEADIAVLSTPYSHKIPYAILKTNEGRIFEFEEKPIYNYLTNGGIYLFKRELVKKIPQETFYNATDFMKALIDENCKVMAYPFHGYWLDIGRPQDYQKAQEDYKKIF